VDTSTDSDRLEAVFREHYEAVLAYARRRAPASFADDVAAETFAVAWRRADQVPAEPLPWLLAVARRVLSTQRRSTGRRDRLHRRLSEAFVPALPEGHERIRDALSRLSERDREALLLVAWEGLRPQEAAVVLGISETAFSVRLHRARRRLRAALDQDDTLRVPAGSATRAPIGKGDAR
jgi:RNA polymerase sigma factor (sigma-70 family)